MTTEGPGRLRAPAYFRWRDEQDVATFGAERGRRESVEAAS